MKKYSVGVLTFIVFFSINISTVFSHSGRTDSSGGHNCSQKSINKGLCTGYHYHNGGSSSGSHSVQSTYNPKEYFDKGYSEGFKKGYEIGYKKDSSVVSTNNTNSDYIEGWNVGYQKGLEEGLEKIQKEEKDLIDGEEKGASDGVAAFLNNKQKDDYGYSSESSNIYITAYKRAFSSAWEIAYIKMKAYEQGFEQGLLQDESIIPNEFQKEPIKVEFEKGHKAGVDKRDTQKKEYFKNEGYKLGYEVIELTNPEDAEKDIYIASFKEGYQEGIAKREEEITSEGYAFAFKEMNYSDPDIYQINTKFLEWFKAGFNNNEVANEIKEKALEYGKEKDEYYIPKKFKVNADAINLYNTLFEKGQKIKEEKERKTKNVLVVTSAVGVPTIGGLYVFMRRKKRKNAG